MYAGAVSDGADAGPEDGTKAEDSTDRPVRAWEKVDWGSATVRLHSGAFDVTAFEGDLPTLDASAFTTSVGPYVDPTVEWLVVNGLAVTIDRKTKSKRHPIVYGHIVDGPLAGKPMVIDAFPTRWRRLRRWMKRR